MRRLRVRGVHKSLSALRAIAVVCVCVSLSVTGWRRALATAGDVCLGNVGNGYTVGGTEDRAHSTCATRSRGERHGSLAGCDRGKKVQPDDVYTG